MPFRRLRVAGISVAFPIRAISASGCVDGDDSLQLRLPVLISI